MRNEDPIIAEARKEAMICDVESHAEWVLRCGTPHIPESARYMPLEQDAYSADRSFLYMLCGAIDRGAYGSINANQVPAAIQKVRADYGLFLWHLRDMLEDKKDEIKQQNRQESEINEHNRDISMQISELQEQRRGARGSARREIDAKIESFEALKKSIPPEITKAQDDLKKDVVEIEGLISEYTDHLRALNVAETDAQHYFKTIEREKQIEAKKAKTEKKEEAREDRQEALEALKKILAGDDTSDDNSGATGTNSETIEAKKNIIPDLPEIKETPTTKKINLKPVKRF